MSILAVRRAENNPIGIIINVGKVKTNLACVSEICGNASRIAAKAGDTAVGAIIVSTDTDKIDGINIFEYFFVSSIFIFNYPPIFYKNMRTGLPTVTLKRR